MVLPRWPEEMPRPFRPNYAVASGDGRRRTRKEAGPVRMRRRFSSVSDTVTLMVELTRNELARFWRFYNEDVAQGSLPFIMADPVMAGLPLTDETGARITDETGNLIVIAADWLCQFGDQLPETTVIGVNCRVSFSVEVLP